MENFPTLNVSKLLCPSCDNSSGMAPCPCEPPICSSQHCLQLYHFCTTIFACTTANDTDINTQNIIISTVDAELDWYFLAFALTLMAAGAVGNVLVCLAVCQDRSLQNSTNYFLLSLAAADLIVSLCVMPLGAIPGFLGYWPLGVAWCSVYVTSDVLACSASILHMCVISLGRYLGIRSPLRARHRRSKRLLAKKVVCVWLLAALISSSITVLGAYDAENIMPSPSFCNINNRAFSLFGSIAAFYAPMLLMVGSYALTSHLLRRKARFGAKARAQRLLQQGRLSSTPGATRPSSRIANGTVQVSKSSKSDGKSSRSSREPRSLRIRSPVLPSQLRLSEHKASTVLGLVFASFVLCWAPFFVLNVLVAVCPRCVSPAPGLVSVCLWLGYSSSTINPIIYTVFNRSFRAALLRLLRCRGAPPPPTRFRSVTECRTIATSSMGNNTTNATNIGLDVLIRKVPSKPPLSSNYPLSFDNVP